MSTWAPALAAAVLLTAVTAGCGGEDAGTQGQRSSGQRPDGAVSVRVVVTGGIAGTHDVYEVSRDDTGSAKTERVLALAGAPAVRDYATRRHRLEIRCCDLQVYEVTIRYADGTRGRIVTDTTSAPPQLRHLVTLVSGTGQSGGPSSGGAKHR